MATRYPKVRIAAATVALAVFCLSPGVLRGASAGITGEPAEGVAGSSAAGIAGSASEALPLAAPDGPGELFLLRPGRSRRVSSADPNWETGIFDYRAVLPGETHVMADLEGPGVIRHLWVTSRSFEPACSRLLTLRMYWDDETSPSVECPLGDFFGVGHGMDLSLVSAPVCVTSDGLARNCYWPMPFRRRARITLANEGGQILPLFYYNVDWEQVEALPSDTAYFHAHYRQAYPTRVGERYVVADIEGRGHYVGTVLSVRQWVEGWYGEGDDLFFLDGDAAPTLRGTGTEDYFCNAWGFKEICAPYYGAPLFEGTKQGNRTSVYRWHVTDPIRFETSLRFELEHNGDMTFPTGERAASDRSDDYASVAFWYQAEPHRPWPAIPRGPERLYPKDPPASPFDRVVGEGFARVWIQAMLDGKRAAQTVVRLPDSRLSSRRVTLKAPNPTEAPMRVEAVFPPHSSGPGGGPESSLSVHPRRIELEVAPGQTGEMTVGLRCDSPLDIRSLPPLVSEWVCTFQPPGGKPIAVSFPHRILFDAPFSCERMARAPTLDGHFDDWPGGLPFACEVPAQTPEQAESWAGPEDGSFRFAVGFDAEFLYIAVDVVDDRPESKARPGVSHEDTVMLQIDGTPPGSGEDLRFILAGKTPAVALTVSDSITPETLSLNGVNVPEGTRLHWRETERGYAFEAALPTGWLDRAQGGRWTSFRLNAALFDFDNGELTQVWWRPPWNFGYAIQRAGTFVRK